jgi:hypothetical protein
MLGFKSPAEKLEDELLKLTGLMWLVFTTGYRDTLAFQALLTTSSQRFESTVSEILGVSAQTPTGDPVGYAARTRTQLLERNPGRAVSVLVETAKDVYSGVRWDGAELRDVRRDCLHDRAFERLPDAPVRA